MIYQALQFLESDLNANLGMRGSQQPFVALDHLVPPAGAVPQDPGQVVMLLTGVDEERHVAAPNGVTMRGGLMLRAAERAYVTLHVMFAAAHSPYKQALKNLDAIVGFMHAKPVFDTRNTPGLPEEIGQMSLAMERLDYAALSNLWSYLGGSYVPSVNYTVRMVAVGRGDTRDIAHPIKRVAMEATA